jgi:uncharacterized protein YcfJ
MTSKNECNERTMMVQVPATEQVMIEGGGLLGCAIGGAIGAVIGGILGGGGGAIGGAVVGCRAGSDIEDAP